MQYNRDIKLFLAQKNDLGGGHSNVWSVMKFNVVSHHSEEVSPQCQDT